MERLTIILLFFASVLQGQTGAGYWHGSTEPGTITPEPDTLTLTYWNDFILLHIANTGITEDANGVSQWQDRSGNGNHSTQTVNANKPSTDVYGNIVFDGTNDYLIGNTTVAPNSTTDSITVFIVYNRSADTTADANVQQYLYDYGGTYERYAILSIRKSGETDSIRVNSFIDGDGSLTAGATPFFSGIGQKQLYTLAANPNADAIQRINGTQVDIYNPSQNWTTVGTNFTGIGYSHDFSGTNIFNGSISFIGIADRKFTPAEIATTESELNSFFTIY